MVCNINLEGGYGDLGDDVEDNDDGSPLPSNRVDLLFCRVVTSR